MRAIIMAALLAVCAAITSTEADARPKKKVADHSVTIVAHPAGCPKRLFCGCGVSVKIWGKPVRALFLASNYGRYFNSTDFRPGVVAWRNGHAAYVIGGTIKEAQLYDPNSGGGKTRIHTVNASKYRFADPHSPKRMVPGLNTAVASYGETTERDP